jgi:AcrR family transcriptional regulator
VIRDEALRLFADRGPEAVTVRDVASAAGVSAGLVIHHFASKAGLRRAVDEYVIAVVEEIFDATQARSRTTVGAPGLAESFVTRLPPGSAVAAYLRRLLLSGDPAGMRLFAQWFEITLQDVTRLAATGGLRGSGDPVIGAALLLINDLGRLLLRDQLAAVLGADPLGGVGGSRWVDEIQLVYRDDG